MKLTNEKNMYLRKFSHIKKIKKFIFFSCENNIFLREIFLKKIGQNA